jgi:adenylate cyclase
MARNHPSSKLAVILHADIAGSTALVHQDEHLAHERIQDSFRRFSGVIAQYRGHVRELRGDALLAEFDRASAAVTAALAFQADQADRNPRLTDTTQPIVRVGIAMGEVVVADNTITGAGVVLAQRVEQLADPGGVCITGAIHEALPQRLPFDRESLGEQQVKGFDEPVRVYAVKLSPGASIPPPQEWSRPEASPKLGRLVVAVAVVALVVAGAAYWFKPWAPQEEPTSVERMALPLPDKPSIAVLPFTNLSGDPGQEYFSDGMTDDLITDLSKISGLFVIARNSSFAYKGKSPDVRNVARELGVRYVLEGSVRRVEDQVRINAQLIDATTGGHLWADRYDGSMADIFALQDKVTKKIVNALSVNLTAEETARSFRREGVSTEAYDAFLKGWAHYRLQTPDNIAAAVSAFERAIALEPGYAYAHAALAASYWEAWEKGWVDKLNTSFFRATKQVKKHLEQAMKAPTPLAHWVASKIAATQGKYKDAIREAKQAIALDSNDSAGYAALASALVLAGRPAESADAIQQAMRLDPHYPPDYLATLGQAQFGMDRINDAAGTLEQAVQRAPEDERAWVYLAAAYGYLGKTQEGQVAVETVDALRIERGVGELTLEYIDYGQFGQSLNRSRLKAGLTSIPEPEWKSLIRRTAAGYKVRSATVIDAPAAKVLHEQSAVFAYTIGRYGVWAEGHIPGSVHLGPQRLTDSRLRQLITEGNAVVFYGLKNGAGSDHAAAQATAKAINLGFKNVYYFQPGFTAWRAGGYPVEKGGYGFKR